MKKTITVLGLGYIGLPTALLLARAGYQVFGFDIDKNHIHMLINGVLPFDEPGLQNLFCHSNVKKNFKPIKAIQHSNFYIIAVPTPQRKGEADLSFIYKALNIIRPVVKDGDMVVLESTVGPLDCEKRIIPQIKKFRKKIGFAHCPERAIPGNTLHEMVHNPRIIGGLSAKDAVVMKKVYASFVQGEIYLTHHTLAAVTKVMENTFRDVNIALANEFAKIAHEIGIDVWQAIALANKHPRVSILNPGPGVGGHCIPIDPWFLTAVSKRTNLILTSRAINDSMPKFVVTQILDLIKRYKISSPKIGILGFAYKKNVDDIRETPAEKLSQLLEGTFNVKITDPYVNIADKINSLEEVLAWCNVLLLVTDHDCYKKISLKKYKQIKFIYDTRNILTVKNVFDIPLYVLGRGGT